jgi:hypothetical protein
MAVPGEKVIVAPLEAIPPIDESCLADALESVSLTREIMSWFLTLVAGLFLKLLG